MPIDRQQSPQPLPNLNPGVLSVPVSKGPGSLLTVERRRALYEKAEPSEQLPRRLPPASVAGKLRVLELERDNLNREICLLKVQLQQAAEERSEDGAAIVPTS